jgi:hypothetical protein
MQHSRWQPSIFSAADINAAGHGNPAANRPIEAT